MRFAERKFQEIKNIERFLIDVDRLKSSGNMTDADILITALKNSTKKVDAMNHARSE